MLMTLIIMLKFILTALLMGPPVSRSRVSGPPGFSAPNMAPPPGFTSRERVDKSLDTLPWDKSVNPSSLFRNQYQALTAENIVCNGDIEFIDPAILAIGKGILPVGLNISRLDSNSSFTPHYGTYEDDVSLQLMRRSMPPDQNQRYTNMGNNFTHLQDLGGAPPLKEHTSTNNISPFSQLDFANARSDVTTNGHWKGLNGSRRGNDSSWQRYS
ncbi:hypothetical protein Leryth_004845 [Lithospermum erythrorhizon]|nr:hypothetical protein Leryth_004845 [Lithospermum erythrorhizon]